MRDFVDLFLNGKPLEVKGRDAFLPLSDFLRRRRRLTGTKVVCAEGDCGACSVLVGTPHQGEDDTYRLRYRSIDSCIGFVFQFDGCHIVTVEGLGTRGDLSPIQSSMVEHFGSQCGFCTPGFVVAMTGLFEQQACSGDLIPPSEGDLVRGLTGNLCRCTGYRQILDAARAVEPGSFEPLESRFDEAAITQSLRAARATPFRIEAERLRIDAPTRLTEALEALSNNPDATVVAGATDLGVVHNKRGLAPPNGALHLLSLSAIAELRGIEQEGNTVAIGATTSWHEIHERLGDRIPELARILDLFGAPQIRHAGTIGGNLMNASPIADGVPFLFACDAQLELTSPRGERHCPIDSFYRGYKETDCQPDELLTAITFDLPTEASLLRLFKISRRHDLDISSFTAAVRLDFANDRVSGARIAMGGVGPTVLRLSDTEDVLLGEEASQELFQEAAESARREIQPISDVRGSAEYRRTLAAAVVHQVGRELLSEGRLGADVVGGEASDRPIGTGSGTLPHQPSLPHDSAVGHVTGSAPYIEDLPQQESEVLVGFVGSPCANGTLRAIQGFEEARATEGVVAVFTASDVPNQEAFGPIFHDEPFLPDSEVRYLGQPVVVIAATTPDSLAAAQRCITVEVEESPAILDIDSAESQRLFLGEERFIRRGDLDAGFARSVHTLAGTFHSLGQEQFYLESQAALAVPREGQELTVLSSTQNPTEIQKVTAEVLGLGHHQVICETRRMGGAFGGKETQAAIPALMTALVAHHTRRPARIVYSKDDDMKITGKRHEAKTRYRIGIDQEGRILAAEFVVRTNGGAFADLSTAVLERLMLHLDNAYFLPNVHIAARVCRTNLPPNTAFRGFGGPQGIAVIESVMEEIAQLLDLDALDVRRANAYASEPDSARGSDHNTTPYGQEIRDNSLPEIFDRIEIDAGYRERRELVRAFNRKSIDRGESELRGLSLVPVKFGISFTNKTLNQANALVNIFTDGTVQVSTGATEMGQGVNVKLAQILAEEFGIDPRNVIVLQTSTEKNNNTSPTAASASTDLNGSAAVEACRVLRARLSELAATMLLGSEEPGSSEIAFDAGTVYAASDPDRRIDFGELTRRAHIERVDLGARGFYATPGIDFDRETGRGTPFYYFTTGCCVAEVTIDRHLGLLRLEQLDVLMDIGKPINHEIELGQVIGGLVQGVGWVTTEELVYSDDGALLSHSPTTYKIPNISDLPRTLNVAFLDKEWNSKNLRSTKAVGEPPLMLGIAVFTAIKDALATLGPAPDTPLRLPATHEEILRVATCSRA